MDTTVSDLIDQLAALRADKKRKEYEVKQLNQSIESVDKMIMDKLDDQGLLESKSATAKVTITESVYPHVEDWPQFHDWIMDNRYAHFLEKRAAVLAYREALSQAIPVPGVVPFTKRKLTFKET